MPKKIKRGKVGRPPSRHRKKAARQHKQKTTIPPPASPASPAEPTMEQEAKVDEFARRVLKVRQIKGRKELFEQMNQIRKYLDESCTFGDLSEVGSVVKWPDLWKKMVEKVL